MANTTEALIEEAHRGLFTTESLSSLFKREVVGCEWDAVDMEKLNLLTSMRWATVRFSAPPLEQRVVWKVCKEGNSQAVLHGLGREGKFYSLWQELVTVGSSQPEQSHALIGGLLPAVLFADGDMITGAKHILMEDLSTCVPSGRFFGSGNPNEWGKDLEKETQGFTVTAPDVIALAYSAAAKLHAAFWACQSLVPKADSAEEGEFSWLRGSDWLAGRSREKWEGSQKGVRESWESVKAGIADGSAKITWDPLVVECLDAAVGKASWEAYQTDLNARPFTLTHGDFHPANFMVRPAFEMGKDVTSQGGHTLVLLDWEMVGLGSGPQDLSQYMISHVEPKVRAEVERGAVEAYHSELKALNPSITMTLEECWAEYVAGGLGRWLWFLPFMANFVPPPVLQFFHDQVLAFLKDHGVTAASAPMPRA